MFRFGRCIVDLAARRLEVDGQERHLEPQAFDLLAYLLEHRDRVVPKPELRDAVWGDQFVTDSALGTRIKEIRQACDDDGTRQDVLRTFRARGYRFVAPVDEVDAGDPAEPGPDHDRTRGPTALVGRESDVSRVVAFLGRNRLVTLVGPGGVGKTTLAEEVAQRFADTWEDGVRTVSLAPIEAAESVVHVFREAAGLNDVTSYDGLIDRLASLRALVMVDNCEHVLREAARVAADVLRAGGDVRLLATSRERLGIPGEQVVPVSPLDDDSARLLLRSRARAADPSFPWSQAADGDVDRLLDTLDRLPLAIEMAAPHLARVGAAELADLLARHVDLLRSADPTVSDRHRTLDALVSWSENLLSADERALLGVLTTFSGPASAEDVAAVADDDVARVTIGPLAALVAKSLAVAESGPTRPRYRVLETVRARAVHRRTPELVARHARHVIAQLTVADRTLRSPDEAVAAERIGDLVAEARTAHAWAREQAPGLAGEATASLLYYAHERQWPEPATWARSLLAVPGVERDALVAAEAALAGDASNRGDYDEARQRAGKALVSADPRVVGYALDTLASVGLYAGDLAAAKRHGSALVELGERAGNPAAWATGVLSEVLAEVYAGDSSAGRAVLAARHPAVEVARSMNPTGAAWLAYTRGELEAASGQGALALAHLEEAVRLGTSAGSHFVVSIARLSALAVRTAGEDPGTSVAAFLPLLLQYRRVKSFTHGTTTVRNLIPVLVRHGRDQAAMTLLGALSGPGAKATYGIESGRVDAARREVSTRVDEALITRWLERGSRHDPAWAIEHAIEVIGGDADAP